MGGSECVQRSVEEGVDAGLLDYFETCYSVLCNTTLQMYKRIRVFKSMFVFFLVINYSYIVYFHT